VQAGDEGGVRVELTSQARARFSDAEVHYRRMHQSPNDDGPVNASSGDASDERPHLTRRRSDSSDSGTASSTSSSSSSSSSDSDAPVPHHRVAVNEDGSPISGSGPQ
jgi:hypothetical protein